MLNHGTHQSNSAQLYHKLEFIPPCNGKALQQSFACAAAKIPHENECSSETVDTILPMDLSDSENRGRGEGAQDRKNDKMP